MPNVGGGRGASAAINVKNGEPTGPARTAIPGTDELAGTEAEEYRLEGIDGTGTDLSRLYALSDGVFAFALTFLAVTIILPQSTGSTPLPKLPVYLAHLEPAFIGYLISFFIIASWWGIHHRIFSTFVRYDRILVVLNSFFLLGISVTPFLVSLLFAYGSSGLGPGSLSSRLAVAIYGAAQCLGGLVLLVIWRHASRGRRLISPTLSEGWIRATEQNQRVKVLVFGASIGLAFVSPLLAELSWIAMMFGVRRRVHRAPARPAPARLA